MDTIEYTSIEEQIEKLKSQHLIIENEEFAKHRLELFGYSNLIKSYRAPYVITTDTGKIYRSGITFEQLFSLYMLDKNLRNSVMATMLELEEYIKEAAADVIAKSFGIDPKIYLLFKNYQNKRKRKPQFTLVEILKTLQKTLNTDKEPIQHYQTKYGVVPPWILFKSVYFSTAVNLIDQFKTPQKEMMIHKIYNLENKFSKEQLIRLMMDTLFICLEYRNVAAHGGRIYNYQCKRKLTFADSLPTSFEKFALLLRLLKFINYQVPYEHLRRNLDRVINNHCIKFPQDVTYLGQVLNIDISSHNIVWITDKSNKYHANRHCSGIKNAKEIDLEKAMESGLVKCKKCFPL